MTLRVHLFPYRTQKLSSVVPKIVLRRRGVKIGRCQHYKVSTQQGGRFFILLFYRKHGGNYVGFDKKYSVGVGKA